MVMTIVITMLPTVVHAQSDLRTGAPSSTRTVTDETGRKITWPRQVTRIVSLAPSVTETLFALGLGDRVVGDTDYCDYPAEAKTKTRIGGPINPSIEQIASLRPDLVIAARSINRLTTVASLQRLGITVYATDPRTVEQVLESTERLDRLIRGADAPHAAPDRGAPGDLATGLVADLHRRLENLRKKVSGAPPKSVFFVVWAAPLITVGRNTFLTDALRWAGARSVLELQQDWPNVSLEAVVRAQPEYLIFASDNREQVLREISELHTQPGWRDLHAMRNGQIVILPESISHPSPRLVDAIEQLARTLYPDRFAVLHPPAPIPFPRAAAHATALLPAVRTSAPATSATAFKAASRYASSVPSTIVCAIASVTNTEWCQFHPARPVSL